MLVTFGGLCLMVVLVAGVTLWSVTQWERTNTMLSEQHQRSVLLHRALASIFRAVKKLQDAVSTSDGHARLKFEKSFARVAEDLDAWAGLAPSDEKRAHVDRIRKACSRIETNAQSVFDLLEGDRPREASQIMERRLGEGMLQTLEADFDKVVALDAKKRKRVMEQVRRVHHADEIVLAIAVFGAISLILLLFAYLASDLFAPLRALAAAQEAVSSGDYQQRLPEHRNDELGDVHRAFNRMVESVDRRQRLSALAAQDDALEENQETWDKVPSRLVLHRLLLQLKNQVQRLQTQAGQGADAEAERSAQAVTARLDELLGAVVRVAAFGFPLDLKLRQVDVRAMLYEVMSRFHDRFAERAVGVEIDVATDIGPVIADPMKLREVVIELVRNALAALPEQGGHVALRARLTDTAQAVRIEVGDDGPGMNPDAVEGTFPLDVGEDQRPPLGLAFVRSIIEQHGGTVKVHSEPGEGTEVHVTLTLTD